MAKASDYTKSGQALQTQQANSPTELIQRKRAFLEARLPAIQKWVTQGVRPEALVRFVLMDMSTNEKLRMCTEQSIYLGLLACAVTGLEPGALKGEAYLVPFAGAAVFMPGWRGLVKQAKRSREVIGLSANVVREADTFDLDLGSENTLTHKPALRGDRGEVIGAYAIARMVGGHQEIEWMNREDLDKIQRVAESRGKSPAWKDWPDQMQRKSPIRRLAKRLPLGTDYYVGQALEQAHEEGKEQRQVLDLQTDGEATRTEQSAAAAESMRAQVAQVEQVEQMEPAFDPEGPITDAEAAEIAKREREQS